MAHDTYPIDPKPPLNATLGAHAATLAQHWFQVSPRTMEAWPLPKSRINGKVQPATVNVWACAAAHYEDDTALNMALGRLPDAFADEVEALLPQARADLEALRERKRKAAKERAA